MTLVLILIAVTAVLTVIVVPVILALVHLPTTTGWLPEGMRWGVSLAVLMTALSLFYRHGPNRVRFGSGMVTPGAALVIVFWPGSSAGFSCYLTNFKKLQRGPWFHRCSHCDADVAVYQCLSGADGGGSDCRAGRQRQNTARKIPPLSWRWTVVW